MMSILLPGVLLASIVSFGHAREFFSLAGMMTSAPVTCRTACLRAVKVKDGAVTYKF
jgi:hypothetical protein